MKIWKRKGVSIALSLALLGATSAWAAGFLTNGLVGATGPLTGNETIPMDTNLAAGLMPQSESVTVSQLGAGLSGTVQFRNQLIGGDMSTNLFQRGTTSGSITTTATYTADRWFLWSGAGTAVTATRVSTAAELPVNTQYAVKIARTAGQTGVIPVCFGQAVETAVAVGLASKTVEFQWSAYGGANFSASGSLVSAYVIYGTGTDEGASKLAFGLNGGGGGSTAWTGQANATSGSVSISTATLAKFSAAATIPSTATEVAAVVCWTPVGTAGTNDYVTFSNLQLSINGALASSVGTTVASSTISSQNFEKRSALLEIPLQQRYYYRITESATIWPVAPCSAVDTTHTNCFITFPVMMRTTPTMAYATGFASPTSTTQATLGNCSALASATTVASTVAQPLGVLVNCTATTIPAAGTASFLYSNNGTGTISASAEL